MAPIRSRSGGVVVALLPVGEPGQGQAHHAQQLTPGVQRRRHHRGEPGLVGRGQALRARRRVVVEVQVGHHHRVQPRHGQLAEVPVRVVDLLADLGPGARCGRPVAGVPVDPADELLTLEQIDEAVVGELRDQQVGHVLEGDADLERAGQPFADPVQQGDAVLLQLAVTAPGLADEDDDPVDVTARVAQRHGLGPHEAAGAVASVGIEGALPGPAAQHMGGDVLHRAHVIAGEQAERQDRLARQPRHLARDPEQPGGIGVEVQQIAEPVGDHDPDVSLAEHHVGREVGVKRALTPAGHSAAPGRGSDTKICAATEAANSAVLASAEPPAVTLTPSPTTMSITSRPGCIPARLSLCIRPRSL